MARDAFKRGIDAAGYRGGIAIESFIPKIVELTGAGCFWRPLEPSQDGGATEGRTFLQQLFGSASDGGKSPA